jgi:hypothetical protein
VRPDERALLDAVLQHGDDGVRAAQALQPAGGARRAQTTSSWPACAAAAPKVSPMAPGPTTATRISG